MNDMSEQNQQFKQGLRIESTGIAGAGGETRVFLEGTDISRYITDVSWSIGVSEPHRWVAKARVEFNRPMLDARAPHDPARDSAISRVRAWIERPATCPMPSMSEFDEFVAELDETRARLAALMDEAKEAGR